MNNQSKNQIEKLLELKKLYESGILTKEEMEEEKAKILETGSHGKSDFSQSPSYAKEEQNPVLEPDAEEEEESFFLKYKVHLISGVVLFVVILGGFVLLPKLTSHRTIDLSKIEAGASLMADSLGSMSDVDTIPSVTEAVNSMYQKVLSDKSKNWEESYFSEDFYDWYQRTMAYDIENHMGSLGFFGGNDIWTKDIGGSDITASVTGVSIEEHPADGHVMESFTFPIVEVTLKGHGKSTKAYWSLVYYDGSWKIDDDGSKQRMKLYLGQTDGLSGAEMWMNRFSELDKTEYWNEKYLSKDFRAKIKKWNGSGYFENYNIWSIGSAEWIDKIEIAQNGHSNDSQSTMIVAITCNSDDGSPEVRNREVKLIVEDGCWHIDDIENGKDNIQTSLKEIGVQ